MSLLVPPLPDSPCARAQAAEVAFRSALARFDAAVEEDWDDVCVAYHSALKDHLEAQAACLEARGG